MRLDGHLHIWSGDEEAFPYFRERGGSPNFNIPPVRALSRWSRQTDDLSLLLRCCWAGAGRAVWHRGGVAAGPGRRAGQWCHDRATTPPRLRPQWAPPPHPPPPRICLLTLRIFHPAARRLCYGRDETVPGGVQGLVRDRPPSWPREGRGGAGAAARELTAPSFRLFTPGGGLPQL